MYFLYLIVYNYFYFILFFFVTLDQDDNKINPNKSILLRLNFIHNRKLCQMKHLCHKGEHFFTNSVKTLCIAVMTCAIDLIYGPVNTH